MKRDDIKEFLELVSGFKKSSRMLAEAPEDEESEEGEDSEEESEEEEKEEKEDDVKITKDEKVELNKSLDDSLNALFVDIESDALKSAAVQRDESYSLKAALLNEVEEAEIDVEKFAAETARIIKNADVLLDIEEIIMSKARDYLISKYGESTEEDFLDIMRKRFSVDYRSDHEKEQAQRELPTPIAVGAGGEGASG